MLGSTDTEGARSHAKVWDMSGNLVPETKLGARLNGHLSPSELEQWNSKHLTGKFYHTIIKPGNRIEWGEIVTRQYDLSKPGTYTVQLEESVWPRGTEGTRTVPMLQKSNVTTITVVP